MRRDPVDHCDPSFSWSHSRRAVVQMPGLSVPSRRWLDSEGCSQEAGLSGVWHAQSSAAARRRQAPAA